MTQMAVSLHYRNGQLSGWVELEVVFKREEDKWVGHCVELGTSAYGDTP